MDDKKTIHLPLQFWFNRNNSPVLGINGFNYLTEDERINHLCTNNKKFNKCYQKIKQCFATNNLILHIYGNNDDIYKIFKDIDCLYIIYNRSIGHFTKNPPIFIDEFYDNAFKICELYGDQYAQKLYMSKGQIVNNYELYDLKNGRFFMRKLEFNEFVKIWIDNKQYTQEEFITEYTKKCIDWNGCNDQNNIIKNGIDLWNLPYPKEVILKTMTLENSNCVRYCNFVCEWIKQKMIQVNQIPSLQYICKKVIVKNGIDFTHLLNPLINNIF